ncbi:hypothetical protein [Sphingobacterium sp. MYb382]|uniref:hypothetical protein n=1 Tax=Sphingobacterium sp. MYb382 TaxID=2745278 RepID=UPI0030B3081B
MKHEIPQQNEGREMDAYESVNFTDVAQANEFYEKVRSRLMNINKWHELAKLPMATFVYLNPLGLETRDSPKVGGFIRIDIPGPGLPSTDGYDYVRIENIDESKEENFQALTITLRPSDNPEHQSGEDTQHFFKNIATSTLQIQRVDTNINASYYGRNEVINLDVDSVPDKIRNLVIGLGAKLGASFPQWKSLLKGVIDTNELESDPRN